MRNLSRHRLQPLFYACDAWHASDKDKKQPSQLARFRRYASDSTVQGESYVKDKLARLGSSPCMAHLMQTVKKPKAPAAMIKNEEPMMPPWNTRMVYCTNTREKETDTGLREWLQCVGGSQVREDHKIPCTPPWQTQPSYRSCTTCHPQ